MSDPQKIASFSPNVRGAISRRVILAAVIATICVVLANLLSLQNPARIVLSQSADHSLSPLTKKVLGALTNDVRAVVLFDRQADLFEPVKNLLTEYERKNRASQAAAGADDTTFWGGDNEEEYGGTY